MFYNIQNLLYFWYNVEFWTGYLIIENNWRIKERKMCKCNFEYLALRPTWRAGRSYPIIRISGDAFAIYVVSINLHDHGPIWTDFKFRAEFENLVFCFERPGRGLRQIYGSRNHDESRCIEIERPFDCLLWVFQLQTKNKGHSPKVQYLLYNFSSHRLLKFPLGYVAPLILTSFPCLPNLWSITCSFVSKCVSNDIGLC